MNSLPDICPSVAPSGVQAAVAPQHDPAPERARTGSAGGVSAIPVAYGYRYDDGSFDVTEDVEKANSWMRFAEHRVFGLYLDHQPADESDEVLALIGWATRALEYLEHPDVQAMGFAAHPGVVATELRAALVRVSGGEA